MRSGYSIIVISDRKVDRERVAIPALLALSAIHQHLVDKGLRTSTGLVVETGSAREVHHFALLGGYGAEAVHPYLALETLLRPGRHRLLGADIDGKKAIKNFVKAIGKGLKKVMSKMGISTYMSYTGAQIFEAVGLSRALVDKYFTGTDLERRGHRRVRGRRGGDPHPPRRVQPTIRCSQGALDAGGEYAWRVRGEEHMWTPDAIAKLQHVDARQLATPTYKEYAQLINDQSQAPHDVPRAVRVPLRRSASRCRSRKSSRPRRSSSASPPARCRSARSRPRRTPRSRSR